MRTTLDIDDDVLQAAKELAAAEKKSAGQVLSELARSALGRRSHTECKVRNGFELLPADGSLVTVELVDRLLEDE